MLLQKIEPYKCCMITEKKRNCKNGLSVRQKLPSESIRLVNEAFSTYSNIKTPLTELFIFFYTHPSVSASAIRASETVWEGERAEKLFSRSGFISSLMLYWGAVTEVSLGTFVSYTYMQNTHTAEWNGNTRVVFQSLAVVLMVFVVCYCTVLL